MFHEVIIIKLKQISIIFIILLFTVLVIGSVSASTITVTGKPSVASNLPYTDFTTTWENTCPFCGAHNLLDNPKGVYEGEITCGSCDGDFCSVTGKDKCGRLVYLSKAEVKNATPTSNVTQQNFTSNYSDMLLTTTLRSWNLLDIN